MSLKSKIRKVLRTHYGEFETLLEHQYEDKLTETLSGPVGEREAWATYNQVVLELKNSLKDTLKVKELQYFITENENPNKTCVDILETIKDKTPELERLYYKILSFK